MGIKKQKIKITRKILNYFFKINDLLKIFDYKEHSINGKMGKYYSIAKGLPSKNDLEYWLELKKKENKYTYLVQMMELTLLRLEKKQFSIFMYEYSVKRIEEELKLKIIEN